jgi:hypothetical protein
MPRVTGIFGQTCGLAFTLSKCGIPHPPRITPNPVSGRICRRRSATTFQERNTADVSQQIFAPPPPNLR